MTREGLGCPAHAGMDPCRSENGPVSGGLPRSRGDGPSDSSSPASPIRAAPLTRGWTRERDLDGPRSRGCPAHAGMDPSSRSTRRPPSRLPRSRGDGPVVAGEGAPAPTAAPLTRGWTRLAGRQRARGGGCPAHAGMDPWGRWTRARSLRLPRSRGDGPFGSRCARTVPTAAPLTRGWTPGGRGDVAHPQGCPAHAGMDPVERLRLVARSWLPRSRGDGPPDIEPRIPSVLAAPLTRGWTHLRSPHARPSAGCPAHAGMDR